jgi:type II secretory pathway component PulF
MKWIVTYRDKSGKRVQDCFDADSKQLLFPILKEKGISPISITELNGKFKPQGNTKTISFRLTKPLIYSVIGIIIISFVTVFFIFLLSGRDYFFRNCF